MRQTRQTRQTSGQRGFTLIEMMTVLAIIGILTAVLSSMASPGAGTPRTSSEEAVGAIQFARLRAESTRTIHLVKFENQTISVWEAAVSPTDPTPVIGYTLPAGSGWALVQNITLPANAKLFAAYPTTYAAGSVPSPVLNANLPFEIRFLPDGGASTGATVLIGDQNNNASAFRIAVYRMTGAAIAREGW